MFTIFTDTDTDLTLKEANEYGYKLISSFSDYEEI